MVRARARRRGYVGRRRAGLGCGHGGQCVVGVMVFAMESLAWHRSLYSYKVTGLRSN